MRMDKRKTFAISAKGISIVFIVIAILGLAGSTLSQFFTDGHDVLLYILNAVGDVLVLLGAIQLFRSKHHGKAIVIVGSIFFGTYGFLMMRESILGGTVTVLIALVFIILTRYAVIRK